MDEFEIKIKNSLSKEECKSNKMRLKKTINTLIFYVFDFYELTENLIGNYEYWKTGSERMF